MASYGSVEDSSTGDLVEFAVGRVILRFTDTEWSDPALEELDQSLYEQFELVRESGLVPEGFRVYQLEPTGDDPAVDDREPAERTWSTVRAINATDDSIAREYRAHVDGLMTFHGIPMNDPEIANQWGLDAVGLKTWWPSGAAGVHLAVIDSGAPIMGEPGNWKSDHPDIESSRIVFGLAAAAGSPGVNPTSNYVDYTAIPRDLVGHGTSVLGVLAATRGNSVGMAGVNAGASVYVITGDTLRDTDNCPVGTSTYVLAQALREIALWRASHNEHIVVNVSLGGPDPSGIVYGALKSAVEAGALIVASSGNAPSCGGKVCHPAAYSHGTPISHGVISVGAVGRLVLYSALRRFPTRITPWYYVPDWSNGEQDKVTVVAPGVGILTTTYDGDQCYKVGPDPPQLSVPGWGVREGTSYAAPLVAGIASLYWSHHGELTASDIKAKIIATARPLTDGTPLPNPRWGYGLIDAAALLKPNFEIVGVLKEVLRRFLDWRP